VAAATPCATDVRPVRHVPAGLVSLEQVRRADEPGKVTRALLDTCSDGEGDRSARVGVVE
jgi:hypothetical protein